MRLFIVIGILMVSACKKNGDAHSDDKVEYQNALGFSLKHDRGWSVSFQKGSYIELMSSDAKSRGVVFPFISKAALSAEACLQKVPEAFVDIFPDAQITTSRKTKDKPDEAIAEFSSRVGAGLALCSVDERSGTLFLAITPDGVRSSTMKSIIASFQTLRFEEPGKFTTTMSGTMWTDPQEKSFTMSVPHGFKVDGGLFRVSPVDLRLHVRMSSDDGAIHLGFGDKDVPKYSSQQNGVEGSIYNPGYGNTLTVKRFVSGGNYAAQYATNNALALGCPGAVATGTELDELTQQLQAASTQASAPFRKRVSAGEATLTCSKDGRDHVGYIFAKLELTLDNMGGDTGTWYADLIGFSAPKDRADYARSIATVAYQSIRVDPTWQQAQGTVTMNTAQIVSTTSNQIANMLNQQYVKTQGTMDRIFRNWSNATLGQTDVVDSATGETYKIASGKNYYWRKAGTNVIAATNQYERPDIDFTALVEY